MADKAPKRDKDVVPYQAFAGLRNNVANNRFSPADLEVATNIDLDATGAAARRAGLTLKRAGAAYWIWSDGSTCLFVEGLTLKQLRTDYTVASLRTLTSTARMAYHAVNDCIYFSNNTDSGVIQNGAARTWGLPVPPAFPAAVTVGMMPAGKYQYTLTYTRADGQESGAGLATVVEVPAGSGLSFTLPVSTDPGVVVKTLYLSAPNGKTLFRAASAPNASTALLYGNDTSELINELQTQFLTAPPAGHMVGFFDGRMWVMDGDLLYRSEPLAYELFDLRRYLAMDSKVSLFAPAGTDGVFVASQTMHGWLSQSNAATERYQIRPLADYGAVPGALAYVDGAMFGDHGQGAKPLPVWAAKQGFCVGMPGGSLQNLTRAKYQFPAGGSGCALFRGDTNQFLAAINP